MKNSFFLILLYFFYFETLHSKNLLIQSKNISLNKEKEISIFKDEVFVKTDENHSIESDYAEYDKKNGIIKFKENIRLIDNKNNTVITNRAEYIESLKIFKTYGYTKLTTSENYVIESEDVTINKKDNSVFSEKKTKIKDKDNNIINLENFKYQKDLEIFKSIGLIEVQDKLNNSYKFSQIYIDTKNGEILGSDVSAYLNSEEFKINKKNDPRVMANTFRINKDKSTFKKSIFTMCGYRTNKQNKDLCPPWTIQASQMLHDNKKKTIYYDNAVIKVYNIPIFYLPKLSHPDPSVKRRTGFLSPTLNDTKNLGLGLKLPYYFAINEDKDFTLTNRLYLDENPLIIGEYRQAFKKSNLIFNMGYTEGYKKTSDKKVGGDKSHFFSKFTHNFDTKDGTISDLTIKTQDVSNDKYLKLYKLDSDLVDYNQNYLENSFNYSRSANDYFLSVDASIFETLNETYNDKYEYILPEILYDKNLYQKDNLGILDLQTNLKISNYDTNKTSKILINDFDWSSKDYSFKNGISGKIIGKLKNVNFEKKNIENFKHSVTNELHGAIGYLSKLELIKDTGSNKQNLLTPKFLLRYAPGSMRKEEDGSKLTPDRAFSIDRSDQTYNLEKGLSATIGFDFEIKEEDKNFEFSIGQIISDKENKKMGSVSSLDEKMSDLVGYSNLKIGEKLDVKYKFGLDQNYNDLNYNEIESTLNFSKLSFGINYLQEKKHIGNDEYLKTNIGYNTARNQKLVFENKRNLVRDSSEYYDLSYEYFNDCLRAGLVFRREFYNDSELEPENSLMFKISLIPFGSINSPSFDQ